MLMFIKSDITIMLSIANARMEVLKKRVLKIYKEDWYDFDEAQIIDKVRAKNAEYNRLCYITEELYHEQRRVAQM